GTGNSPRQRSLTSATIGASVHVEAAWWRYRTMHASPSWPSAKTSASTVTFSPSVRLAGNRPASISGETDSMATRFRPSADGPSLPAVWGAPARSAGVGGVGLVGLRLTGARATVQSYFPPPCRGVGWGEGLGGRNLIKWGSSAQLTLPPARRSPTSRSLTRRVSRRPCPVRGAPATPGETSALTCAPP